MQILLTGATGYIGKRLLPLLIQQGHHVYCCVRDKKRFSCPKSLLPHLTVLELDLLDEKSLEIIPEDIDIAYYLVHSMSSDTNYMELEKRSAKYFTHRLGNTRVKQVIYLSGIINEKSLSEHLSSRSLVEQELAKGSYHFTCLRAGIIVGSGSASFEIMRDLVEKLPFMIAPKWLLTKCQPIGIANVLEFLVKSANEPKVFDANFDIGGPDILTYKEMLLQLAEVRKLRRRIAIVPVMTPKLSSYWLYFVTSTSFKLAQSLVDSMKVEVICRNHKIDQLLGVKTIGYKESVSRAFEKIENEAILSSWKDSYASSGLDFSITEFVQIPVNGCLVDSRIKKVANIALCIEKIWKIGGDTGWYYANWLWLFRGFIDRLFGGVGLRRGRTSNTEINVGDALDFWRVIYANKEEGRLILFSEMKLPGEAWLEFKIVENKLMQTATFRPLGVAGRLYWILVFPMHEIIFEGMIKKLVDE